VRPRGTAGRMARDCVATDAFRRSRWPRRGNFGVSVMPSLRACRARPSAGWTIPPRKALRGKPGDKEEVGFLGGARSPRPDCKASRMAKGFINGQGWARNRLPNGEMPRSNPSHPRGPAETPFRKGSSRLVKIYGRNHLSDKLVPSQLTWQSPS